MRNEWMHCTIWLRTNRLYSKCVIDSSGQSVPFQERDTRTQNGIEMVLKFKGDCNSMWNCIMNFHQFVCEIHLNIQNVGTIKQYLSIFRIDMSKLQRIDVKSFWICVLFDSLFVGHVYWSTELISGPGYYMYMAEHTKKVPRPIILWKSVLL